MHFMFKKLIFQECCKKHKRIPALKAHNVLPIEETLHVEQTHEKCKKHGELLEYFCTPCEEAICVTCTCDLQHEEHCDQIVDFETGLKELKASMNKLFREFKQNAKKVEECAEILTQNTYSIKKCKGALSAKCQEVETILNQMKEQLQVIDELYEPLRNSHQEINMHFADVQKQMTEINNLQQGSDVNFIKKIKDCRRNCDRVMNDTQMILNRKFTIPESIKQQFKKICVVGQVITTELNLKEKLIARHQPDVSLTEKPQIRPERVPRPSHRQADKYKKIKNLELLSEIKPGGTVDMRNPLEVVSVGDGTVILVDYNLKYLQRINTEGNVVRRYQITLSQQVNYVSACVYGDYLFILTSDKVITKMSLDGLGCNIKYKPERVEKIDYMSAIGDNVILISQGGSNGRILEYNIETKEAIKRVDGLMCLGKVSLVQAGHHTEYIVKYLYVSSADRLKWGATVYNQEWNLISTIDIDADVLTVTPGGKLILVYNNRIHEYSQKGRFIRELLDKYKFTNIQDITFSGGCIWVLEGNPWCIKIFISN